MFQMIPAKKTPRSTSAADLPSQNGRSVAHLKASA